MLRIVFTYLKTRLNDSTNTTPSTASTPAGLPLVPSNKNYLVRDNGQSTPAGEVGVIKKNVDSSYHHVVSNMSSHTPIMMRSYLK